MALLTGAAQENLNHLCVGELSTYKDASSSATVVRKLFACSSILSHISEILSVSKYSVRCFGSWKDEKELPYSADSTTI